MSGLLRIIGYTERDVRTLSTLHYVSLVTVRREARSLSWLNSAGGSSLRRFRPEHPISERLAICGHALREI